MKTRVHVLISGRVQGVFFRHETKREAARQGVSGWIRNLTDDRVEAVFEGEPEKVKKLLEFCERGPLGAKVTRTDVNWETYSGELTGFEIRY
jgi:acylphosphatase